MSIVTIKKVRNKKINSLDIIHMKKNYEQTDQKCII